MEKRRTPLSARSDVTLTLPDLIEKKRLDWIQNCQSWRLVLVSTITRPRNFVTGKGIHLGILFVIHDKMFS